MERSFSPKKPRVRADNSYPWAMNRLYKFGLLWMCVGLWAADLRSLKKHDAEAIARATESDAKLVERVKADPNHPAYHITAPANWINDPNGPIFHNGYWHMFYQHNPYGDDWGSMHWGHVRSRDLAHWEHLPIALWPSKEAGEDHVFSGCAAIRADGRPVILYTSIGRGKSATDYAEQWMALGDRDLLKWEKAASNPVLSDSLHGNTKIWDWRDPFLFKYQGADYLVLGGNLNKAKGGEAIVGLYKAKDPSLENWEYLGILFKHPDPKVVNIECPNFFELDGKWVLIVSPHRRVEYFVGNLDGKKFTSDSQGLLDHSDNFYAPNCTTDDKGRRVLWGWIRGFKSGQGWNGALTVPRVLKLDNRGRLFQQPAEELAKLRGFHSSARPGEGAGGQVTEGASLESFDGRFEISAEYWSGNDCGVRIFKSENDPGLEIFYKNGELKIGAKTIAHVLGPNDPLRLHIFVDRSVIEIYANGTTCFTAVHYPKSFTGEVEFFTNEKNGRISWDIFELKSAWGTTGR
jgi:sucrose-6-phosphate hydrolase SacC (GH32 family)